MKWKLFTRSTLSVIKIVLMLLSAIIVVAWIVEHLTHKANFVITAVSSIAHKDHWLVAAIIVLVLGSIFFKNRSSYSHTKNW